MKKRMVIAGLLLILFFGLRAQELKVAGPDGRLEVYLWLDNGKLYYRVNLEGQEMLEKSPLGLRGEDVHLSDHLQMVDSHRQALDKKYEEPKIKRRQVHYQANELQCTFENDIKQRLVVTFRVSNNDIAFRYGIPQVGEPANLKIKEELSGFKFPGLTTTFLTPQASPMIGWKKTKPSYEEEYVPDQTMDVRSKYGLGYTFPALFRIGNRGWVLLSETGANSSYCASKLGECRAGLYQIAFPEKGENNGIGDSEPTVALPAHTPWRTLTVGKSLKPIVETTVPFDVVEPQYEASKAYTFGRATWSWLEWQDESINFEDQKTFIDLSAAMGYEYVLIDNWWDTRIGHAKIEELATYGRGKGVGLCLWYNSNGYWNDAPQTPKNKMNNSIARKKEMAWMQSIGIKGIKVDFFGGDKQETLKLYEDILSDANDHGITVIFHGCTLPRGWERMYPNFVGSEAVLASENLIFTQHANDTEAFNACLHPFIRNAVAAMDFGPVLLNRRHSRGNNEGTTRKTTESFQLATSVLFQTPVQNFGLTPNNLKDMPKYVIDFLKQVPTTWDETVFLDGYPGKYVVLARRKQDTWYIAGINAETKPKEIELQLSMLSGQSVQLINDDGARNPIQSSIKLRKENKLKLILQPHGGVVLYGN